MPLLFGTTERLPRQPALCEERRAWGRREFITIITVIMNIIISTIIWLPS